MLLLTLCAAHCRPGKRMCRYAVRRLRPRLGPTAVLWPRCNFTAAAVGRRVLPQIGQLVEPTQRLSLEGAASRVDCPPSFRHALVQAFAEVAPCFDPLWHKGQRRALVDALKACRLPAMTSADVVTMRIEDMVPWMHRFVQELWKDAVRLRLAINQDGSPMKLAAAEVARSVVHDCRAEDRLELHPSPSQAHADVGAWLKAEEANQSDVRRYSADSFHEFVSEFWRFELARVDRAEALRLISRLGGDDLLGWLRSTVGDSATGLYKQVLGWRRELQDCVMLVQVGDFFESWGVDAVMLVQWCGLRAMAQKPRAGFPASAAGLQQVLDALTNSGLSAAVFVQTGAPGTAKQPRTLRQVVTPGTPTYLYGYELTKAKEETEFLEGKPFVGLRLCSDGILYVELRPSRREVYFREGVTPEGVEALLAENSGIAEPIFLHGVPGSVAQVRKWNWIPRQHKWLSLPDDLTERQFVDACCRTLCTLLHQPVEPEFHRIRLDSRGAMQPLTLATAANLGVLPRRGVPSLVDHMLDKDAPAASRRFARRWLLAPRSEPQVLAMRKLISAMLSERSLALPPFSNVPSVAKVVAYISARTAAPRLLRDLRKCCQNMLALLSDGRYQSILAPLLLLVAAETGNPQIRHSFLVKELEKVVATVDEWLAGESDHNDPLSDLTVVGGVVTQSALSRFAEANEGFRGVVATSQPLVAEAYEDVKRCRDKLCAGLLDLIRKSNGPTEDILVYNPFDNDLCLKFKPENMKSTLAHDRKGKAKSSRYTTSGLSTALQQYLKATQAADIVRRECLYQLSVLLGMHLPAIRAALTMNEIVVTVHRHVGFASARGWQLAKWSGDGNLDARVVPYWLDVEAVSSHVVLGSGGAIATGPNMSGKSTLMRSLGASALLTNCGFLCPASGSIPRYRQVFFLAAEGDRPGEGVSSFGQEAMLSSTLLNRACGETLALVDEFGRGTDPLAAKACVGALLEELLRRGSHFVVATHLYDIVDMALDLPASIARPTPWRMGSRLDKDSTNIGMPQWTYTLERGVCHDSFADVALRKFGWSEEALSRYSRLLEQVRRPAQSAQNQPSTDAASVPIIESVSSPVEPFASVASVTSRIAGALDGTASEVAVERALCEAAGCIAGDVVCLRSETGGHLEVPPAALCECVAILYVLALTDGQFYVGQTDNLRGRLQQHRRSYGGRLKSVLVAPVLLRGGGTGAARLAETCLQRALMHGGLPLVSGHDARHRHFGVSASESLTVADDPHSAHTVDGEAASRRAQDVARLRRAAQELLEIADDLERGR